LAGPGPTSSGTQVALGRSRYHRTMDIKLLELLVCPVTKGPLNFDRERQELLSRSARLAYPVREGIPILLENEARTLSDAEIEKLAALRPPL
jgi:uncharacterized protein YbaR (Trm112 family)